MARFLTTADISSQLEDIIRSAKKHLILISPYLQVNDRLREFLEEKDRLNREIPENKEPSYRDVLLAGPTPEPIDIRIVYGKNEEPGEKDWLESLTSVKLHFRKNLHAKCYLNEDKALLTSMNLYAYSQVNNDEMGILVRRRDEAGLYERILEESMRLASGGDTREQSRARKTPTTAKAPEKGFCISCRETISPDAGRPHCKDCWRISVRQRNDKHCHICGEEHDKAAKKRPACSKCYWKHKKWVDSTIK